MKVFCSLALTICLSQFSLAAEKEEHRDNAALFPPHHADSGKSTPPAAVKLLEPAFQAKLGGTETALTWEASQGATSYHVQVATDPNFKWLLSDEHFVTGTKFQAKGLEKGKTYYWRVAPWKDGNLAATNKGPFSNSIFEIQ